ncbi:unnamed protein product [Parascedosporium putredinis]|uniref:STAS domain-containing protein n=1 Tax=Parascedosporium putredinis TaxID=1442378 RepID=A0A9P1H624_9PEZI|nr:unnamed protein product [Parascedosporium putredinis]CAI7998340.1 unnamed protein product [Parascedosporium putredinis]
MTPSEGRSNREDYGPIDTAHLAQSVREDTAELASYALSDRKHDQSRALNLPRSRSPAHSSASPLLEAADRDRGSPAARERLRSPQYGTRDADYDGRSIEPSDSEHSDGDGDGDELTADDWDAGSGSRLRRHSSRLETVPEVDEHSPLLAHSGSKRGRRAPRRRSGGSEGVDIEAQQANSSRSKILNGPKQFRRLLVGLLLNILDALSYGMILFPLANPIFSHLGSAGISIFYVSTIISQLIFSNGSIFKGGVGSELIEVVPFFHNMAETITIRVGRDNADAVIATTIVSYASSSMLTGAVFYLMGKFKFGYMVGFIPRHILIGCIGGVGFFLVVTGFEVSARLEGGIEYNLETLKRLAQPETLPLWITPLVLAFMLFYGQSRITSKYFLPFFIISIPIIFYLCILALRGVELDGLRGAGWVFEGPPPGEPWWYFYTLYKFELVHWDAVIETIPAMFALTFFGILHVPINVPALALNTGEDNADLDRELRLHGYSNFISGCAGSIQNYLVYANTMFFMRSGGDSRLAGVMLAGFTFVVMTVGPSTIHFIPVMMVGTLIFDLGFELLFEAVWLPRKKLKVGEYATVIIIVLVMGVYDFVVGIGIGILLAFVNLVTQTAAVPAVRAAYSGEVVTSTVRRNPSQSHYLKHVGRQIFIVKLTGYLFFGTIVSVEEKIRNLIDDRTFSERPIRFLVIDLWHVTGLDYSAGEAFNRINLNSALESCENELLKTYYVSQEARSSASSPRTIGKLAGSPKALEDVDAARPAKWQGFKEPLRLMLQIFQGLSEKNEDFWFRATPYFAKLEYAAGTVLFRPGTTCGDLPFFSETRRTATVTVERASTLWMMDAEKWAKIQREEPEVAWELQRMALKLTSQHMTLVTSYILTMAG